MKQEAFNFNFRPAMGADDFVLSDCNREAVLWLDAPQRWNSPFLIVAGPEKSGKTHLCRVWAEMTGAVGVIDSAIFLSTMDGAGMFFADNAQPHDIAGEKFLFHLYNVLKECGGKCILTSRALPKDWNFTVNDTSSRILSCPTVEISAPDESLIESLLTKGFKERQLLVKHEIISYLVNRIERSFKAIDEVLNALDEASMKRKKPMTLPLVSEVVNSLYAQSLSE